jgi:hypothetical protein
METSGQQPLMNNLCEYIHPKYLCGGRQERSLRKNCKYFPPGKEECPHFNIHGCEDCDHISAQFEGWVTLTREDY